MAFKDKQAVYNYTNEFNRKSYDRISVMLPKGDRERLQTAAAAAGESVNGYIKTAIRQRMDRDRDCGVDPSGTAGAADTPGLTGDQVMIV